MKKIIFLLIVGGAVILFSFRLPAVHTPVIIKSSLDDSGKTTLALYGEYIFQREDCTRCHTLVDSPDLKKVSLDGLIGKYPDSWHYIHLFDPLMMVPGSRMPAFTALFERNMDNQLLLEIDAVNPRQYIVIDTLTLWIRIQNEVNAITNKLKKDRIEIPGPEQKEIIALIAFLQQIPTSLVKRTADSIKAEAMRREQEKITAEWNKVLLDENSAIMKYAGSNHPDTIAAGKELFQSKCYACHGMDGGGMIGPNLTDNYWLHGNKPVDIIQTIRNGVPEHGMPSWKDMLHPVEIGMLTAYIRSLKGTNPAKAKAPQGKKE